VTLLIVLFSITIWLVNRRLTAQVQRDARLTLATAEHVFLNSLDIRSRNLIFQYENLVNEPRFKAVAQLGEQKTMTAQLEELRHEMGAGVMVFTTTDGHFLAGAPQDSSASFEGDSKVSVRRALQGNEASDTVAIGKLIYNIVSIPVRVHDEVIGALTVGVPM